MSKSKQILTIVVISAFFIGVAVFVLFTGVLSHDTHWVKIEVNPKVEFLTDDSNKVISVMPLNQEAKILLIQEDFIGKDVDKACEHFVKLCAESNYIDVEGEDNVISISIVSGFMQALEMKVYEAINGFLLDNEIKGIIVETDNDIALNKEAKEKNVTSASKLSLIQSLLNLNSNLEFENLNKLNENQLIHKLEELHSLSNYSTNRYTSYELNTKIKLIDFNRVKYENHINSITPETQSSFGSEFDEFKRKNGNNYEIDFANTYNQWLNNKEHYQ